MDRFAPKDGLRPWGPCARWIRKDRCGDNARPRCCRRAASTPSMRGLRPGSRGHKGPTHAAGLGAASRALAHQWYARLPPPGAFCALRGPPLRRGPFPCAGPLRRGAPAAASRARSGALRPSPGPPPGRAPRLPRSAPCARCRAPRALAGPVCLASPSAPAAGSLSGRPCSAPGRLRAARGPAGAPLGPPSGLRGRLAPAPGLARPCGPRSGRVAPRGLAARPRLRGLAGCLWRAAAWGWVLPCAPPAPPPPLGAPGSARLIRVASPPAAWVALLAPLLRPPLALRAGPVRIFSAVDNP